MEDSAETPHKRVDPERKQRIIESCLTVIADRGIAGTSHRVVAAEAHVPLGSMTYHFDGMHDLLHQAFDQFADRSIATFAARMSAAQTPEEACEAIADSVEHDVLTTERDTIITLELYTLAARDASFRDISDRWMGAVQQELSRFFDARTVALLDAMIEGLTLHRALGGEPRNVDDLREGIRRVAFGKDRSE
ncbi:TetR/AcrR family transcriptional regulator [Bifidobacterium scaligerum]|uniref:TetR family transcriptional regulator n=1 Tax=Bifidobacterium scaligerum TaxID=2052656 RepID=A0A2M9HPR8_9BIFI|nr:TetR family transcriptional regulator [Bifidobacterium scaligerum]PJM78804.1 TetR family transcriptional regulator [Bifidobacterium scaligerum]